MHNQPPCQSSCFTVTLGNSCSEAQNVALQLSHAFSLLHQCGQRVISPICVMCHNIKLPVDCMYGHIAEQ